MKEFSPVFSMSIGSGKSYRKIVGSFGSLKRDETGYLMLNAIESKEISKTSGYMTNHHLTHSYKFSDHEALVSSVCWIALSIETSDTVR